MQFGVFEKFTSAYLFQIARQKSCDYLLIIYVQKFQTNSCPSSCIFVTVFQGTCQSFLISTFYTDFVFLHSKNFKFLHCLGLIDMLSANKNAEIFVCILLRNEQYRLNGSLFRSIGVIISIPGFINIVRVTPDLYAGVCNGIFIIF